jgi:hypothetical protein
MARRRSARLWRMLERCGLIVLLTLVLADVGSLRYALVITPTASASFGVMNGALLVQVRDTPIGAPRPALGRNRVSSEQRKLIDFYRHGFATAWWVRGWDQFWWSVKARRPAPRWVHATASGVPKNAAPGAVRELGDGTFMVASGAIPGTAAPAPFRLEVPLWMPILLLGAPCILLWMQRCRRRRAPWQCHGCGYDLRGMSGEKCPECGAAVQPSAPSVVR